MSEDLQPDNVWEYKLYYPNGKLRIHTFYRKGDVLLANDSFAACWDQARVVWSGRIISPQDCIEHKLAEDLYRLYVQSKIAAYYHFISFYENGEKKSEGGLVRKDGRELKEQSWCGTGITYLEYDSHTIMDGVWAFYNEDGTTLKKVNYENGTETK